MKRLKDCEATMGIVTSSACGGGEGGCGGGGGGGEKVWGEEGVRRVVWRRGWGGEGEVGGVGSRLCGK